MQYSKVLIKVLTIYSFCASSAVFAGWTPVSYANILNAALKQQPLFEKKLRSSSSKLNIDTGMRFNLATLRRAYTHKQRTTPADLVDVFKDPNFNTVTIPYYKNGFGKQLAGGLDKSTEYFIAFARHEKDEDIKLILTMFATYYYAEAHYPSNTVSYFDHGNFSRGDDHGLKYCLSKNNPNFPNVRNCRLSVNSYWSQLIEHKKLEVDDKDVVLLPVKTVIEETANLAPKVYSVPPNYGLHPQYIRLAEELAKSQGELAASRIVALWNFLYF